MAHILETKSVAPSAASLLEIVSAGSSTSIVLTIDEVKKRLDGADGRSEYQTDKTKSKQLVTFIGADGAACEIEGVVWEQDAVSISAAHKVVVSVQISNELAQAYEKGQKSRGYMAMKLVQVLEVWDTPKSCYWKASLPVAGKVFDTSTGKIA